MGIKERHLPTGVEVELDLFSARSRDTAGSLVEHIHDQNRLRDVATLAIEFWDMIDGIDHVTALGGTEAVQQLAHEGREAVRNFIKAATTADIAE